MAAIPVATFFRVIAATVLFCPGDFSENKKDSSERKYARPENRIEMVVKRGVIDKTMRCTAKDISRLLDEIGVEVGQTPGYAGLLSAYDVLNEKYKGLTGKSFSFANTYLYRKLFRPIENGEESLNLNTHCLDAICKSLGYLSYTNFIRSEHPALNKVLEKCIGGWYSYVRCNSGNPDVLVSPVKIFAHGKSVIMLLQGKVRKFTGEMKLKGKCIYCTLESESDKQIHLVLKVGLSDSPDVLQGVFSGISSGEDPIAGREILVRQSVEFDKLKNSKEPIEELCASNDDKKRIIGNYFNDPRRNILSAGKSSTFSFADLQEYAPEKR